MSIGQHSNPIPRQSPEETLLYAAILARADEMHPYDGMTILPQPFVVAKHRRFRPDFVLTMRSVLAVQVDDPSHYGKRRYCADRSQDELLGDCGVPVIRVPLEDTLNDTLREDWVDRIIARISRYRPVG